MKKLFNILIFNFSLFVILFIGIQNSKEEYKVSFFNITTIDLPVSFIIGSSFIVGSFTGSFLPLIIKDFPQKKS